MPSFTKLSIKRFLNNVYFLTNDCLISSFLLVKNTLFDETFMFVKNFGSIFFYHGKKLFSSFTTNPQHQKKKKTLGRLDLITS